MTVAGKFAESICNTVKNSSDFPDVVIAMQYNNQKLPVPFTEFAVAVSVKECEIGDRIVNILSDGTTVETTSRKVLTTLAFDIYYPYICGGNISAEIFDRLATFLIYKKGYKIVKAGCSEAVYDKQTQSILRHSYFTFETIISS